MDLANSSLIHPIVEIATTPPGSIPSKQNVYVSLSAQETVGITHIPKF